jgi:superfamily I DNA/RNA helicase
VLVWSFTKPQEEAQAIALSCQELINTGMTGREDEILILIANRPVQLNLITQELDSLNLPYDPPRGTILVDESEPIRAVFALLRIAKDQETGDEDYPAHRDILGILSGVGQVTVNTLADACIANNQNFRQLFHLASCPTWITGRSASATQRVMAIVHAAANWTMADTLASRAADIADVLSNHVYISGGNATDNVTTWNAFASKLPPQMTLDELHRFLASDRESDQQTILDLISQRIGVAAPAATEVVQRRIRILTMHGAKGLSGKVVFIPSAEQGIMPNFKAIHATGLLIEQRRLFYVSLTRATACCIISHANQHTGAQAMKLTQKSVVRLTRSQFLDEMGVRSTTRTTGLSTSEATSIMAEVANL